jgi:imidazolonepropionase
MTSLAVLHASQLVTLSGPKRPRVGTELSALGIIRDGGMLIRDGKIESVGPSAEIEKNVSDAEVVDAGGRVVMPGFVDAHTHLVFAGNRLGRFRAAFTRRNVPSRLRKRAAEFGQLLKKPALRVNPIFSRRQKSMRTGSCVAGLRQWKRNRATALTVEDELKILRVMRQLKEEVRLEIVPTFLGAHAVPRELSPDEYLDVVVTEMLPR